MSVFSEELTEAEMGLVRGAEGRGASKAPVVIHVDELISPSATDVRPPLDWSQIGFILLAVRRS